jgi:protein-S-isoprenylcysteine O-methyltransferase Ste14
MTIFIKALRELTLKRVENRGLVTTGPYRLIRHPQHLGLSIALLPLSLFNISYSPYWTGIRPGDIFAWSFVIFLLLVVADYEEANLVANYKHEFEEYCLKTPFFLPWKFPFRVGVNLTQLEKGKPARYIIGFAVYWCIMVIALYPFTLIELGWTL